MITPDLITLLWPNNRPIVTTEVQMAKRGMVLECVGPEDPFGRHEAWFVDILGRHEMHFIT